MQTGLRYLLLLLLFPLFPGTVFAQQQRDSLSVTVDCVPKDIQDFIFRRDINEPIKLAKKIQIFIIPLVGFSPSTHLQFGVGSTVSWYMGKDSLTKLSAGIGSVEYTLMHQLKIQLKTNILFSRNNWFLRTDWRLYIFNLPTFGLGTGTGDVIPPIPGDEGFSSFHEQRNISYPMDFNWIKFHNVLTRRIIPDLFIGPGFHFDYHFKIDDELLDSTAAQLTPHYSYSVNNGFNPEAYITSGVSANIVYDSRDNVINPYKGIFAQLSYRYNALLLGSSRSSSILYAEFRTYIGLSKRSPRHLLAFWAYGNFLVSGKVPYLDLMATGFDQMNSSGRGYILGRWRGEDLVYGEAEYRFPISRCSDVVGGVLFANVTTASNRGMNIPLFKYLRGAAGFGVRIMLNKLDRTNLVIDFGIGGESTGLYIQAQEIF